MARRPFGGTTADVALDSAGDVVPGATVTVWTAATGGTRLTDLQTPAAVAIAGGAVTADAYGVVAFLGPADGTSSVYVDGGRGGRTLMIATDLPSRVATLESNPAGGTAATTTFTPAGSVAATNVQAAIVEVASEYAAADTAEASTRASADTALQTNITAEATARTSADALLAPLASPALTGNPTAPTQTAGNNSTRVATTAFVATAVSGTSLPAQTGNGGKFLQTDGTATSWATAGTSVATILRGPFPLQFDDANLADPGGRLFQMTPGDVLLDAFVRVITPYDVGYQLDLVTGEAAYDGWNYIDFGVDGPADQGTDFACQGNGSNTSLAQSSLVGYDQNPTTKHIGPSGGLVADGGRRPQVVALTNAWLTGAIFKPLAGSTPSSQGLVHVYVLTATPQV